MSDPSLPVKSPAVDTADSVAARRTLSFGRMGRLALKELRETLRDRRTIITLVLMPVLVYPLLSLVFHRFLLSSFNPESKPRYVIGVSSRRLGELLIPLLLDEPPRNQPAGPQGDARPGLPGQPGAARPPVDRAARNGEPSREGPADASQEPGRSGAGNRGDPPSAGRDNSVRQSDAELPELDWVTGPDMDEQVRDMSMDLAIRTDRFPTSPLDSMRLEIVYRPGSPSSEAALRFFERRLNAANVRMMQWRMARRGLGANVPVAIEPRQVEAESGSTFSLGSVVPLILILMTVTGAVYPAIDLTAGERERGTLETLMAAPVPKLGLLLAKYVAVLLVAVLTATVNLVAMVITVMATGLGPMLFGSTALRPELLASAFGLLVLFAAFFSAVLLAITSFARSFKEAQAYLIPLMLVSLAPGILSLIPGIVLTGPLAVTPLVNIVLLARDLMRGPVNPLLATVAVLSTLVYTAVAISIAARVFGADALLYGGGGSWRDLWRRPAEPLAAPSVGNALICLALIFPASFVLSNALIQREAFSMTARLLASGLLTAALFGGVPIIVAVLSRVSVVQGFQLKPAAILAFPIAVVLGFSVWPFAHEVFMLTHMFGVGVLTDERIRSVQKLIESWREISPVVILACLAIAPAVCEELFFRGYLYTAIRKTQSAARTILLTALLFGLFHVVSSSMLATERFLPSACLGLALGWVCHRTGSTLPGIVMHACHNGFLLMVARYRPELERWGWATAEREHLPTTWLAGAAVATLIGGALLWWVTRNRSPQPVTPEDD